MNAPEFAVKSRRVVTPEGVREAVVVIGGGRILDVVAPGEAPPELPVRDEGDRVVMPGLVDPHVHVNEPGRTAWEGFETATKAAAAGGITALVDMPLNSDPVTTTVEALRAKAAASEGKRWVDVGFYGGLVPENARSLGPLLGAGILGVKAFLVPSGLDAFPPVGWADLRAAMPVIASKLLVHAERMTEDGEGKGNPGDARRYEVYAASRPEAWEQAAIREMIALVRETGCRVHVVHLAAASAVPMLEAARREGLPITVETCPHYLFFSATDVPDGDTRFKCAPPIRDEANREGLWAALRSGVIDFIASDHSPCPPAMKHLDTGDFRSAWGGIASLQLSLPALWTAARARGFTVADVVEWMSRRPAAFLGLSARKGSLAPGRDADVVVWDPERAFTVAAERLFHRHKVTPYAGKCLYGVIEKTYLRGRLVYEHGRIFGEPWGSILRTS
ncbi:allantoinase AllB [Rhodocaloribacter sp.]